MSAWQDEQDGIGSHLAELDDLAQRPEFHVTHRITHTISRSIVVKYGEPVELPLRASTGRPAAKGVTVGFAYSDGQEADVEPERNNVYYRALGEQYRADGRIAARMDFRWANAARKYMNEWIALNPDWWKVPTDD